MCQFILVQQIEQGQLKKLIFTLQNEKQEGSINIWASVGTDDFKIRERNAF